MEFQELDSKVAAELINKRVHWREKSPGIIWSENEGVGDVVLVDQMGIWITYQVTKDSPQTECRPHSLDAIEIKPAEAGTPLSIKLPT